MPQRLCRLSLFVFWLGVFAPTVFAQSPPVLVFNTGVGMPYTTFDKRGFLDQAINELFSRLGRKAEVVVHESTARALLLANDGIEDGAAMRVQGLERNYPNLFRVPEKLIDNHFVAYAIGPAPSAYEASVLEKFEIAYITGWQVFESRVKQGTNVTRAQDARQLFSLLKNGRAEIALYESWQGGALIRDLGIAARRLEPPVASTEMFIYLHAKHAALAPRAAEMLAAMKRDGTWQRIAEATLGRP